MALKFDPKLADALLALVKEHGITGVLTCLAVVCVPLGANDFKHQQAFDIIAKASDEVENVMH